MNEEMLTEIQELGPGWETELGKLNADCMYTAYRFRLSRLSHSDSSRRPLRKTPAEPGVQRPGVQNGTSIREL